MVQQKSADILKKKDDQNWNEKVSDEFLRSRFGLCLSSLYRYAPHCAKCVGSRHKALKTFISFLTNEKSCSSIHTYNMVSVQ